MNDVFLSRIADDTVLLLQKIIAKTLIFDFQEKFIITLVDTSAFRKSSFSLSFSKTEKNSSHLISCVKWIRSCFYTWNELNRLYTAGVVML